MFSINQGSSLDKRDPHCWGRWASHSSMRRMGGDLPGLQGLRTINMNNSATPYLVTCFVLKDVPTWNSLTQGNASCLDLTQTVIDRKGCQRKPCNQRQCRCFYLIAIVSGSEGSWNVYRWLRDWRPLPVCRSPNSSKNLRHSFSLSSSRFSLYKILFLVLLNSHVVILQSYIHTHTYIVQDIVSMEKW